ncbi:hypothetical protein [Streptomyces heilongjiangensis]|uniref:Uncharacterized protein n=1 Tax=Streptomyces heilongjiangensis TaxID=945052 RepID=A0ABW1BHK1_9ACTN|nr:hypothetical protein [Streptomyces heilongjiangensis]MDC2951055.1 hypothetical protein [Streptomyces heilongjiangensis]
MTDQLQPEPAWDTPEYRLIGLERITSTIPDEAEGAAAYLSATVAFGGDGDEVKEAEVFQKAADYFKSHPELAVQSANWTTFRNAAGLERFQLELSVVPPGWIPPEEARRIYPRAKQ